MIKCIMALQLVFFFIFGTQLVKQSNDGIITVLVSMPMAELSEVKI